ncbi:hypothetical protein BAUCODRAFT_335535 [Baudoinia panamericana UAMH 10762]|uniref:Uncharacterized protein n=1 Tax=Baudoinia panamericana (strain UAMH 10762) TaxID=717646 RepID=M2MX81_BAUPA|nr:uncharacterized protein BAUCODRAFT_335535 [Baudoinia panamericana UAMH 10762]EMC90860.1 hypothetical protein BAUCODRAFT_335535 [Baudoinia panamericana UAMH 10762]
MGVDAQSFLRRAAAFTTGHDCVVLLYASSKRCLCQLFHHPRRGWSKICHRMEQMLQRWRSWRLVTGGRLALRQDADAADCSIAYYRFRVTKGSMIAVAGPNGRLRRRGGGDLLLKCWREVCGEPECLPGDLSPP